ncbi:MAG: AmmeMemoRadiSam system protein B [Candidatus Margulisbacteria bacterium]|nr:AmmeMemoRadiSam system protein B [Candidatus Margulisiibacteriota bacterium]
MRKVFLALVYLTILTVGLCLAEVRRPAVAGAFYPADRKELAYQVDKFLSNTVSREVDGEITALIVPHAGYPFSGQVAADAYRELKGRKFGRVIIIGASHKMAFDQIALPAYDFFETPLGQVPVDREFIKKLKSLSDKIVIDNQPHDGEHSIEVQLPFLQTVLPDFKVVPILFGNISLANCQTLAYALSYLTDDDTLIIASSDWSHYYPSGVAVKLDSKGTGLVVRNDLEGYVKALAGSETEACGAPAIITTMLLAPALGANKTKLLKYANSGDVTGDRSKVVGYAAVVFYRLEPVLSSDEKKKLLRIAHRTVESKVRGKKLPVFTPLEENLNEKRGAFVTLKKNGELRGCIGYITPIKPLFQAVQETAVQAAANDRRFLPVEKNELKDIVIEVSALSRLKKVKDVAEIEIGRDGLYIVGEKNSGLLLPQVPVEWGWDRDEFLKQVGLKAGLPADAWHDPNNILFRFTADVFSEKK